MCVLTDTDAFLDGIGEKDSYIPLALNYGRTADGNYILYRLSFLQNDLVQCRYV